MPLAVQARTSRTPTPSTETASVWIARNAPLQTRLTCGNVRPRYVSRGNTHHKPERERGDSDSNCQLCAQAHLQTQATRRRCLLAAVHTAMPVTSVGLALPLPFTCSSYFDIGSVNKAHGARGSSLLPINVLSPSEKKLLMWDNPTFAARGSSARRADNQWVMMGASSAEAFAPHDMLEHDGIPVACALPVRASAHNTVPAQAAGNTPMHKAAHNRRKSGRRPAGRAADLRCRRRTPAKALGWQCPERQ